MSFEPHTTATYLDPTRIELIGKPDYICVQPRSYTHIEFKAGRLNNHRSKDSSFWALREEYMRLTGTIEPVTYNFLAEFFDKLDKQFSLDNAWNHSLYKVLSLQADKGWQNYLVMFERNPKREDGKGVGELIVAVLAQVADMERARIAERTASGRTLAKATLAATGKTHRGATSMGRPAKADATAVKAWRTANAASISQAAAHFGLSDSTVKRYCAA